MVAHNSRWTLLNKRRRRVDGIVPVNGWDEVLWKRICAVALAAREDKARYLRAYKLLGNDLTFPKQRLAGLYVGYLARYRVASAVGGTPTEEDIAPLALALFPRYSKILPGRLDDLEETLRTTYKLSPPEDEVKGATFTIRAFVIVGLLLENSDDDLRAMRPHLVAWCSRQADSIREICAVPPAP